MVIWTTKKWLLQLIPYQITGYNRIWAQRSPDLAPRISGPKHNFKTRFCNSSRQDLLFSPKLFSSYSLITTIHFCRSSSSNDLLSVENERWNVLALRFAHEWKMKIMRIMHLRNRTYPLKITSGIFFSRLASSLWHSHTKLRLVDVVQIMVAEMKWLVQPSCARYMLLD